LLRVRDVEWAMAILVSATPVAGLATVEGGWWTDRHSGTFQIIFALVLVVVTGYYAWTTRSIASETKHLAEETAGLGDATESLATQTTTLATETRRIADKTSVLATETARIAEKNTILAAETERLATIASTQYLDTTLPVIVFNLKELFGESEPPTVHGFDVEFLNAGPGPALDVRVELDSSFKFEIREEWPQPFALRPTEYFRVEYRLDERHPFGGDDALRWANQGGAIGWEGLLIERRKADRDEYPNDPAEHYEKLLRETWDPYIDQVRRQTSALPEVGLLRARYRDVHGREVLSEIPVRLGDDEAEVTETGHPLLPVLEGTGKGPWRTVQLGPLTFSRPSQTASKPSDQ
jgi:hypothetical protein